jgi:hypothetical protein
LILVVAVLDIGGNFEVMLLQPQLLLTSTLDDSTNIAAEGCSVGSFGAARLHLYCSTRLASSLITPLLAVHRKGFDLCHPSGFGCTLLYGQLPPHVGPQ